MPIIQPGAKNVTDWTSDAIPSLPAEVYHLTVSPVLEVTTKIAAARGDPDLFNDMPSMLALMTLVEGLGHCYLRQDDDVGDNIRDAVEAAPAGACLMVLYRGELDQAQIEDCLWALQKAQATLTRFAVLGREEVAATEAWQDLVEGHRKKATERLEREAMRLVANIDRWERDRNDGNAH